MYVMNASGCRPGSYDSDGLGTCKDCPLNTYSSDGADECTECPDGKITWGIGTSSESYCKGMFHVKNRT